MEIAGNFMGILDELRSHFAAIDGDQLERYAEEIAGAGRIFVAGAGRSGLMIRAFAMRLMHLGKEVHVVGEVTTPRAVAGDLLLIGSGSGETGSLVAAAEKARACSMRIALNTIDAQSTLAGLSDVVIALPGASQKVRQQGPTIPSIQPMGSSYEQLSLLVYDAVVMALMNRLGHQGDGMFARHANIE